MSLTGTAGATLTGLARGAFVAAGRVALVFTERTELRASTRPARGGDHDSDDADDADEENHAARDDPFQAARGARRYHGRRFEREFGVRAAVRTGDGGADAVSGEFDVPAATVAGAFQKFVLAHRS